MTPFNLKSLKKHLKSIDLKTPEFNYSLQPFINKWIEDNPPLLSYNSKSIDVPFKKWKNEVFELVKEKVKVLDPLPLANQKFENHGEFLVC